MREARRYLGLELSGAKSQRTSLAVLEFYPKEKKIFLLDIFDKIVSETKSDPDEALLDMILEVQSSHSTLIGVNVPLEFPPCITCTRKTCPLPSSCTIHSVKWMRTVSRRFAKHAEKPERVRTITPYTQRPVELWIKHHILPKLPPSHHFEIDETLGGNRAPLTARMNFLNRHLQGLSLVEVWPKLSVSLLALELGIAPRVVQTYRHLEDGLHSREEILALLAKARGIFLYEPDRIKIAQNLTAFDAFICAYTALISEQSLCAEPPKGFPKHSGWVQYPHRLA